METIRQLLLATAIRTESNSVCVYKITPKIDQLTVQVDGIAVKDQLTVQVDGILEFAADRDHRLVASVSTTFIRT